MDERKKYNVMIGGEQLTLIASEGDEYIDNLTNYMNEKIKEIQKTKASAKMNSYTKMLLIMINIADDYYKELGKNPTVKQDLVDTQVKLDESAREKAILQKEINALQRKIDDLEKKLKQSKAELAEYIEAFDSEIKSGELSK